MWALWYPPGTLSEIPSVRQMNKIAMAFVHEKQHLKAQLHQKHKDICDRITAGIHPGDDLFLTSGTPQGDIELQVAVLYKKCCQIRYPQKQAPSQS